MSDEAADALHVGIGVAAACIGVMCSMYHCCCRVWRRLKGHTPAVAAGAVVAAGTLAASQFTGVSISGPVPSRGNQTSCSANPEAATSQGPVCGDQSGCGGISHTVSIFILVNCVGICSFKVGKGRTSGSNTIVILCLFILICFYFV
jgi:hypothetical protein